MENRDSYFKRRRRRRGLKIISFLLILAGFLSFVYFLIFNKYLLIERYEISIDSPAKERIEALIRTELSGKKYGLVPANNFLFFDQEGLVTKLLDSEPSFESFSLNYSVSERRLNLRGQARQAIGYVCHEKQCFSLDKKGIAFSRAQTEENDFLFLIKDSSFPEIKAGASILPENFVDFVMKIKNTAGSETEIVSAVLEEDYLTAGFVKLTTDEDWYFLSLFNISPETVLENLNLVLEKEIKNQTSRLEYIDLRYVDKAYYKLNP